MSTPISRGIDIIGDVHGYADDLEGLLGSLGYVREGGFDYRHPEGRMAIFVGDFVDRGPQVLRVLQIVRAMVDGGVAHALMGNHEFNALCMSHFVDGRPLRPRDKPGDEHSYTVEQIRKDGGDYQEWLAWLRTLPLFWEGSGIRVVHACWDDNHIEVLRRRLPDRRLTPEAMDELAEKGGALHRAVKCTLKGKEVTLPRGITLPGPRGRRLEEFRVKWWALPRTATWQDGVMQLLEGDWASQPFDIERMDTPWVYPLDNMPVFFGHYGLDGPVGWQAPNVCCVDFNIYKNRRLVACRWNGEVASSELWVWSAGAKVTSRFASVRNVP